MIPAIEREHCRDLLRREQREAALERGETPPLIAGTGRVGRSGGLVSLSLPGGTAWLTPAMAVRLGVLLVSVGLEAEGETGRAE